MQPARRQRASPIHAPIHPAHVPPHLGVLRACFDHGLGQPWLRAAPPRSAVSYSYPFVRSRGCVRPRHCAARAPASRQRPSGRPAPGGREPSHPALLVTHTACQVSTVGGKNRTPKRTRKRISQCSPLPLPRSTRRGARNNRLNLRPIRAAGMINVPCLERKHSRTQSHTQTHTPRATEALKVCGTARQLRRNGIVGCSCLTLRTTPTRWIQPRHVI